MSGKKREERGTFRRSPRHSIEVYIDDKDQLEEIRNLISSGIYKSGTDFGRHAFESFLKHQRWRDEK